MSRMRPAAISSRIMNLVIWKPKILGRWSSTPWKNSQTTWPPESGAVSITWSIALCAMPPSLLSQLASGVRDDPGPFNRPVCQQQRQFECQGAQVGEQEPVPEAGVAEEREPARQQPGRQQDREKAYARPAQDGDQLLLRGAPQGQVAPAQSQRGGHHAQQQGGATVGDNLGG